MNLDLQLAGEFSAALFVLVSELASVVAGASHATTDRTVCGLVDVVGLAAVVVPTRSVAAAAAAADVARQRYTRPEGLCVSMYV